MRALRSLLLLAGVLAPLTALAQTASSPWVANGVNATGGTTYCQVGTTAPNTCNMPVSATVSASVSVAPLTSTNLSGTISVTNTFQSIQASTAGRNGCLIQNNSTANEMWVYFGAIGGATKGKSFGLPPGTSTAPGGSISCSVGGLGVLTDQVSITGTATDAFTANFQ